MDSEEEDSEQTPLLNKMGSSVNYASNSIPLLREADAPQEVRAGDETHSRQHCWLKFFIRLLIYSPLKFNNGSLWISLPHFLLLLAYVAKLALITILVFKVGECRARLSTVVLHGQTALRHILLLHWDATYETLPYPPSIGVFAAYDIEDLKGRINYSVAQYYNADNIATGTFRRTSQDNMKLVIKYFEVTDVTNHKELKFVPKYGLTNTTVEGQPVYSYDVMKDLEHENASDIMHNILTINISANLHSFRVHQPDDGACCLQINLTVLFNDIDHDGQVEVRLETQTEQVLCKSMGINATDDQWYKSVSLDLIKSTLAFAIVNMCVDVVTVIGIIVAYVRLCGGIQLTGSTKRRFNDLSYLGRWWIVPSITGDAFAIAGTFNVIQEFTKQTFVQLQTFDKMAVNIGLGCLLAWICVMRYLKVHVKVSLLFHTLYYAKWNVLAFLVCASILFVGYLFCAYVALGVYHFKFQNIGMSADALFALTQGDDVFATFSGLSKDAVGDPGYVQTSLRILTYSFIILFTIIILNLLIALFNSAYEIIMKKENGEVLNSDITRFERVFYRYISQQENGHMKQTLEDLLQQPDQETEVNQMCSITRQMGLEYQNLKAKMETICMFDFLNGDCMLAHSQGVTHSNSKRCFAWFIDTVTFSCMQLRCSVTNFVFLRFWLEDNK
ncbi:hypothetical protein DPMN_171156 [Dreissena polymorpha]|uniref:Polycystin cation channel PKD1/PKD2 domain-containing protein n=2 Tax=Dreissena polymorpha TaxID=45954 RepID=A0A9D4E0M0_DREPO|nr:hypothetical protein DPMN_171156 [Dreissena polymorpha]